MLDHRRTLTVHRAPTLAIVTQFDLLPEQPTAWDNVRRFGPPGLLAVVAFLFIVQNTESTHFRFLWFDFEWPLWIMLVASMIIGAAIAALIAWRVKVRRSRRAALAAQTVEQ